jgi:hypothetical protein
MAGVGLGAHPLLNKQDIGGGVSRKRTMNEPNAWQAVGGTIWTSEDNRPLKPEWQGLTDADVHELTKDVIAFRSDVVKFIREAEAKLREKNT